MANIALKQELVESNTCEEREEDWSLTKCVVCKVVFKPTDKSYLLECLHTVCNACLQTFVVDTSTSNDICPRECPGCRVVYHCPTFIENKFINDLLFTQEIPDENEDLKCSNHPEMVATDWCDTCAAFICETCVTAHKQLKPTKDHVIKSKIEYIESLKEKKPQRCFPCNEHPKELMTVFCASCNMMTCRDCQLTKHRAHDYAFLSEIANSTREALQNVKLEIESRRYHVDGHIVTVRELEAQVAQKKSKLLNEIKEIVLRLTEAIRKKGTELVVKVDEVCQAKLLEMTEKKEKLESSLRQIDHCSNFVRNALEMASDPVLVYSKEHVMHRLNHVRDDVSALNHMPITFNMELHYPNIDDFVKALSRFAKIKSDPAPVPDPALTYTGENGEYSVDMNNMQQNHLQQQQHQQQQQQQQQQPPHPQLQQPPQRANSADHFAVPNYMFEGVNQVPNPHYPGHQMRQAQQQMQVAAGPRYPSNGAPRTNLIQTYLAQPQSSSCAMPRDNSPSQGWGQPDPNWQASHTVQSSNYRQPSPQQQIPQGQNVIRVAANQQVTSTSNMYKPLSTVVDLGALQSRGIIRLEPVPTSRVQHGRKMFPNSIQQIRQMPPGMVQSRFVLYRNHASSRSSPPWVHQSSKINVVKVQQQQQQHQHQQQQQQQQQVQLHLQQQLQQQPRPVMQGVSWHIPQTDSSKTLQPPISPSCPKNLPDPSFKILLTKSKTPPTVPTPTSVSSSAPETPPNPNNQNRPEVAEALDTLCQASLDDVLRTLSDLDKDMNSTSTHKRDSIVHSSTGSTSNSESGTPQPPAQQKNQGEWQKEDPNEDWCAVCMDGGELVCCDNCPKVFHINCHIPALPRVPQEIWQCSLCRDVTALPYGGMKKHSSRGRLTEDEHNVCERILLELYCQYDCSLHFREPIPPENTDYHKVIKKPMCLDHIRKRLTISEPSHYCSVREFISDLRLVFKNAFTFNPIGSQIYADGMTLEEFLESLLTKFLPLFAHTNLHDDLDSQDDDEGPTGPVKKARKTIPD